MYLVFQVKPVMDVGQVPEFFVLLHSTELQLQRTEQRTFLLQLLRDGLKSKADYLVCARRRVFRLLLSLQPSQLLADHSSKVGGALFVFIIFRISPCVRIDEGLQLTF